MNDKFDELAKGMAQSVTRRSVLKKFGVGLAGVALASLGLASKANANPVPNLSKGWKNCDHCNLHTNFGCLQSDPNFVVCYNYCYHQCIRPGE